MVEVRIEENIACFSRYIIYTLMRLNDETRPGTLELPQRRRPMFAWLKNYRNRIRKNRKNHISPPPMSLIP